MAQNTGEEYGEQLGLVQEDISWEPHEAYSGPGESSDASDAPGARRGPAAGRSHGVGLPRKRQQRPEWTREEEEVFVRHHCIRGNSWSAIAEHLPGRTAAEVKNIWHSTLRSKHLKSRSLLRTYALEVQERGDSLEAREEAFRVARLNSGDGLALDAGDFENNGHGEARVSGSPDRKVERPGGGASPYPYTMANKLMPRRPDPAKATDAGRDTIPRRVSPGSSGGEDATSLASDLSPSQQVALRRNHTGSQAQRPTGTDSRQTDTQGVQGGSIPQQRRRKPGCESQSHLSGFMVASNTMTNAASIQRTQRRRSYRPADDHESLEPSLQDSGSDLDTAAVGGAIARGRLRSNSGGEIVLARPETLKEPRDVPLQPVMWQPQHHQRPWPATGAPQVKRQRKDLAAEEQQEQQPVGGRGLWVQRGSEDPANRDDPWRGGGGMEAGLAGGNPRALADGLSVSGPEELARLQVLRILQPGGERGPRSLQEAAPVSEAWLSQRLPSPLAQMLAEWQLLVQAKANLEAEEAHRLAMLRHYLANQLQEARHMDGGTAAAAIAAVLGGMEENNSGSAGSAWRLLEPVGAGSGTRGPQRAVACIGPPFQAAARRAPFPAIGGAGGGAAVTAAAEDYYKDVSHVPLLTQVDAVLPHARGHPTPRGFNPVGLVPQQQQMAASLKQLGALLGARGMAERVSGPHADAMEAAALVPGWIPPGTRPTAMGSLWDPDREALEVENSGTAIEADMPPRRTKPSTFTPDELDAHTDGRTPRGRPAAVSSTAEAWACAGAKRRVDSQENAFPGDHGISVPESQAQGPMKMLPGMTFINGRSNGTNHLCGSYNQHGKGVPGWAGSNGNGATVALLYGSPSLAGFRAAGGCGPCVDGPADLMNGGRQWDEVEARHDAGAGQKARLGRRQQQQHPRQHGEVEDEDREDQRQLQRQRVKRSSRDGTRVGPDGLGVDASESDVAKALLSFSQLKPQQTDLQARSKLAGRRV